MSRIIILASVILLCSNVLSMSNVSKIHLKFNIKILNSLTKIIFLTKSLLL